MHTPSPISMPNASPYDLYFNNSSPRLSDEILISRSMALPLNSPSSSQPQQRPQWGRGGSWRKYIRVSSRKLLSDNSNSSIPPQKSVTINESANSVLEVPAVPVCRHEDIWYKKSDYDAFEKDRQLTALDYRTKKKKGRPYIEREHTVRGLEELFDLDDSQRALVSPRSRHVKRVLDEQTRQRSAGIYPNVMMLREISIKSSKEARHRSAVLGEADALSGYVSSSRSLQRQAAGVMHSLSRKLQA